MYTLSDVNAAEVRIRLEVPHAAVRRDDYGWRLTARSADRSRVFHVFWHDDNGAIIIGNIDAVIAGLKSP